MKGSRFLIKAVEELQAEGVAVELQLVQGVQNSTVRELLKNCDIAADQFIVGWYALFAIEAMSMGKPVLTYLHPDYVELYSLFSFAGECPIVNTPVSAIKENIRQLVADRQQRIALGRLGREYVRKYHSLEAIGAMFDSVYREIWPFVENETVSDDAGKNPCSPRRRNNPPAGRDDLYGTRDYKN